MNDEASLAARLADVRARIAGAALRAGRDPSAIRLIAISKTHPVDSIRAAVAAGQREFGENRVQEALQKMAGSADVAIRWHLVGHLQSNKARRAGASFSCIHSIDSVSLMEAVDRAAGEAGTTPELLIQVDMAGEPTKHGAAADRVRGLVEASDRCRAARLVGLMLLPPYLEDPEEVRPHFRALRALRDHLLGEGVPASRLAELSMGMSHDFEVAIEEGATMVRIGTAIFGSRPAGPIL